MLVLGVFSPAQLVKISPAFEKEMDRMPKASTLCSKVYELKRDQLYSFRLDVDDDSAVVSKLCLCPQSQSFTCTAVLHRLEEQNLDPIEILPKTLGNAAPEKKHYPEELLDEWTSHYQMLRSHISSVLEARPSLEFSPSFTPCEERQAINEYIDEFLRKSHLETKSRLAIRLKRKLEQQTSNEKPNSLEDAGVIKPVLVKSETVSPSAEEVV